jgi:hypothetical protein
MGDTAVVWFRRDLRVCDQPIFLAAADAAPRSLALFVLDPALLDPSGAPRRTFLYRTLRALDEALGGRLHVVRGDPADVVPLVAAAVDAATVHVAAGAAARIPARRPSAGSTPARATAARAPSGSRTTRPWTRSSPTRGRRPRTGSGGRSSTTG